MNLIQGLWVIERRGRVSPSYDGDRFLGALALLNDSAAYVVLICATYSHSCGEDVLLDEYLGFDLNRDAFRFHTLDEALAWAERMKEAWTRGGWTEVAQEPRDQ